MLKFFLNVIKIFNRFTSVIAMIVLFLMMLVTTIDVLGRFLFQKPIQGSFELTEIMLVSIVFCSMAFCQFSKGHISVDIAMRYVTPGKRKFFTILNYLLTLVILILIIWKSFEHTVGAFKIGDETMILGIPLYPFIFLVVLGCTGMSLEIIRDLVSNDGGDS